MAAEAETKPVNVFAAAAARAAAAAATKPATKEDEPEPEWDGWKEIFLVGTEWTNFDDVYEREWQWNFDHLYKDLKDGDLSNTDKKYYVFGTTEPQVLDIGEKKMPVVPIPVFVVIECDKLVKPISELGIKSVQMAEESIVPLAAHRMSWATTTVDTGRRGKQQRTFKILQCTQRRANLKNMTEEAQKAYEYCMPYIFLPHLHEGAQEYSSNVNICRNVADKQLVFQYDWRMDELDEVCKSMAASEELKPGGEEELKAVINEEVAKAKEAIKAERAKLKAKLESYSAEEKAALKAMRFFKYYPQNKWPDLSSYKAPFINRYFGRTHVLK